MLAHSLVGSDESAPIILYLHGLGIAGWSWDPVHAALPDFTALVPDLPGHGASAEFEWNSIADTAAAVADVVDSLPESRPIHVTGHSLGAYVGWILIWQRPERFSRAVLSGFHIGSPAHPTLLKLAYLANSQTFRVPPLLRRFASVLGDADFADRFVDGAKVIRPRTIRRGGFQVVDFKSPSGLDATPIPILAIAGDKEPEAIRLTPTRLAARNKSVRGMVLEGRDHLWPVKEPLTFAGLLADHLGGRA